MESGETSATLVSLLGCSQLMFIGEHPRIPFGYPKLPNSCMLITQHWPILRWSNCSFNPLVYLPMCHRMFRLDFLLERWPIPKITLLGELRYIKPSYPHTPIPVHPELQWLSPGSCRMAASAASRSKAAT